MKKSYLLAAVAAFLLVPLLALAGPFIESSNSYVPGAITGASITLNSTAANPAGSPVITCVLKTTTAGIVPSCDASGLPIGVYTAVLSVNNSYNCVTAADGASGTCTSGGSVPSAPFVLTLTGANATRPVARLVP